MLLSGMAWAQQYAISTVAGGASPKTPGAALNMSVAPARLAVDGSGNLYFGSRNAVFKADRNV